MEDVYEPLAEYRDKLKDNHEKNVRDYFEKLVEYSGVDEGKNSALVDQINKLARKLAQVRSSKSNYSFLLVICIIIIIGSVFAFFYGIGDENPLTIFLSIVAAFASFFWLFKKLLPKIKQLDAEIAQLEELHAEKKMQAYRQMAPLNQLYHWGMSAKLFSQTVPRIELDPFFTEQRMQELREHFDWNSYTSRDKSILAVQSGAINGNPFLIAEALEFSMGSETYHGSKQISWRERVTYRDSEGKLRTRWETRYQTLHASVTKPAPRYQKEYFLVYGNEAAPDLIFERWPSKLSKGEGGFAHSLKKKREIRKLEKFSRNLDDDYGYTMMGNKEFEVLFQTMTRNDEVQYRLLFTPLAQQQMINLLKDKTCGYGDNFAFLKNKMINTIYNGQLPNTDILINPARFATYCLKSARKFFLDKQMEYFKAIYFSFAPLLSIPLYQQHRSHKDIYRFVLDDCKSCSWEHEASANFYGEKYFEHRNSVTKNILKTRQLRVAGETQELEVTAYGFSSRERVDYVSVYGGDGHWHRVPVYWIEYREVSNSRTMYLNPLEEESVLNKKQRDKHFQSLQKVSQSWRVQVNDLKKKRAMAMLVRD